MPSVQRRVLEQMNKKPKLIVLDTMNFWMDNFMPDLKEALKEVDVLTINDEEARQLSEEHSLVSAAKKILEMGPKYLIIKKGSTARYYLTKQTFSFTRPTTRVGLDPTGAGDSFAGGFIGYISQTDDITFENMKKAVVFGSIMASFALKSLEQNSYNMLQKKD